MKRQHSILFKAALIVLFCVFCTTLNAQQLKQTSIPHNKNGDTTVWYEWQIEKLKGLKLDHLAASRDSFKIRFWRDEILFELTTNDYIHFTGFAVTFTKKLPKKEKGNSKLVYKKYLLSDSLLTLVYKEYLKVKDIPSQEEIKGWSSGYDGEIYSIETADACCYRYKNYWSPYAVMDEIPEAALIETFADTVREILKMRALKKSFINQLKPGKYNDGSMFTLHVPTKAEIKWTGKHWAELRYFDKMEDSVKQYLSKTLTQLDTTNKSENCYYDYKVRFSKHNKVFYIKMDWKNIIDFEEWRYCTQCKTYLKRMLRKVDLSFIKSRMGYSHYIRYIAGGITVY